MDGFGPPTSRRFSLSLDEQQDSPPPRPRRAASATPSGDVGNARSVCRTKGGTHVSLHLGRVLRLADPPTSPRLVLLLPKLRLLPSPPLCEKTRLQDSVRGLVLKSKPPSMQRPLLTPATRTMTTTPPNTPTSASCRIRTPRIYLQGMSVEILLLCLLARGRAKRNTPRPGRSRSFTRH